MALSSGDRLGPYEILDVIGEGGMGRVYRARDTSLGRLVAIKVLPESVASDPDRIARFDREARSLAALNHPHIAQIYGTEQSGNAHALVMEFVEGEDLAQRLARGPMAWREARPVAVQIAEALEAAHEQGIVHRDVKPANIKLSPDGEVKVLDFGLAKAAAASEASPIAATITSPAALTQAGFVLGTAAYMSPEQAKGRPADKRSDVWAFGCVLFEMLAGKRAFPGEDVVETLAAVVRGEPDLSALPVDLPHDVRALITRCLVKERRARVSDIGVARYVIESSGDRALPDSTRRQNPTWPWAIAAIAGVAAIAAVAMPSLIAPAPQPSPVIRASIDAPSAGIEGFMTVAISPQGTHLAYAATQGATSAERSRLNVRNMSDTVARPLPGTEGGANPFFSPDGAWLGFFADAKLKKVPVAGGAAQVIADAPSGRGASWGPDGTIVFVPSPEAGLRRVSADGGAVTELTKVKPDERSHRWPHVLPNGRAVLFTIQPAGKLYDDAIIAAVPIDGGEPRTIVEGGSYPQYVRSGHLVYGRGGTLLATAFDPVGVKATGGSITLINNSRTNQLNGAVPFAVSTGGLLVYLPGESLGARMTVSRATRVGQTELLLENRLIANEFSLSPDGRRVALTLNDGQVDIWLLDLDSRGLHRFTFGQGTKTFPVWSPDGARLYFGTTAGGSGHLVVKGLDGTASEQTLTTLALFPTDISPDGRSLLGRALRTGFSFDVIGMDLNVEKSSDFPVVATAANEVNAVFSPDGRFVAYQSDESGRTEIFVQAFPSGNKWQVTTTGGMQPRWTPGSHELIYRNGQSVMAVPIAMTPFSVGTPQTLFTLQNLFAFDVTADGKTFVVAQDGRSRENVEFVLVSGWFEELRAKMQGRR